MKISTTWSSSRMATRVSWPFEEMIISLFMEEAPRNEGTAPRREQYADTPARPDSSPASQHANDRQEQ